MGYTTFFNGEIKFDRTLSSEEAKLFDDVLGEDVRNTWLKKFDNSKYGVSYIDWQLNDDHTGILHDGSEKSYEVEDQVRIIIAAVNSLGTVKDIPPIIFNGIVKASGEEPGDVWALKVENSIVSRIEPVYESPNVDVEKLQEQLVAQQLKISELERLLKEKQTIIDAITAVLKENKKMKQINLNEVTLDNYESLAYERIATANALLDEVDKIVKQARNVFNETSEDGDDDDFEGVYDRILGISFSNNGDGEGWSNSYGY